jgi:hypothetical protein
VNISNDFASLNFFLVKEINQGTATNSYSFYQGIKTAIIFTEIFPRKIDGFISKNLKSKKVIFHNEKFFLIF